MPSSSPRDDLDDDATASSQSVQRTGPRGTDSPEDHVTAKSRVRAEMLARRRAVDRTERARRDCAITSRLGELLEAVVRPPCDGADGIVVCAFVPDGNEAGGAKLPQELHDRGVAVWLPVPGDHGQLGWARYHDRQSMTAGRFGIPIPDGPVTGPEAIANADLVVVPAVAVDRRGRRLGRGGGFYDRALARVRPEVPLVCVVDSEQVCEQLPVEDHDRPVHAVLTEQGLSRFRNWHSTE